jgi:hypothetical protein
MMRHDEDGRGDRDLLTPGEVLDADTFFVFREGRAVANFDFMRRARQRES